MSKIYESKQAAIAAYIQMLMEKRNLEQMLQNGGATKAQMDARAGLDS